MQKILLAVVASATLAASPAADDAIRHAVASHARDPRLVARDAARHPFEELSFFGVQPASTVVEVWPGGGYWTQILAPLLHDHGVYYAAFAPGDGAGEERLFAIGPDFQRMLQENHPSLYDKIQVTEFGTGHPEMAPRGSADFVLTFRNLHNWMSQGNAPAMLAAINRALKPGGILGIEDHRGSAAIPQDPKAASGYVRQDYAIRLIERAGFKLVASSEINANPRDTTIWPKGVWTLPPVLALKDQDREKYLMVGEADNFVLKFRKVHN